MTKQVKHLYEFGPFLMDATERVLRKSGHEVMLRPKAYEVLVVLVENSGHIVDKEVLMQKVWPNSYVAEANLTQNISVLRKILSVGDDDHQYIETIPRRGYRFMATVKEIAEGVEILTSTRNSEPFGVTPSLQSPIGSRISHTTITQMVNSYSCLVDKCIKTKVPKTIRNELRRLGGTLHSVTARADFAEQASLPSKDSLIGEIGKARKELVKFMEEAEAQEVQSDNK